MGGPVLATSAPAAAPMVHEKYHSAAMAQKQTSETASPLPCPGFEGFEKRLEVEFAPSAFFQQSPPYADDTSLTTICSLAALLKAKKGLRGIPRSEIDAMLSAAQCTVVSSMSNTDVDAYVLSESSLFVFANQMVIKTCGTTKLLNAIPDMLKSAGAVGMTPARVKYSRGSFIFPEAQPAPHRNFLEEVRVLDKYFGHLGDGGKAYMMGDQSGSAKWHVYAAAAAASSTPNMFGASPPGHFTNGQVDTSYPVSVAASNTNAIPTRKTSMKPTYTMEMCMTKLPRDVAQQFYNDGSLSAVDVTTSSGIGNILPRSRIDEFLFEPCGYSMNGIQGKGISTVHITPEEGFSYASFEAMGYEDTSNAGGVEEGGPNAPVESLGNIVTRVADTFRPGSFSLAVFMDGIGDAAAAKGGDVGSWDGPLPELDQYKCSGTTSQLLPGGASLVYHTFEREESASAAPVANSTTTHTSTSTAAVLSGGIPFPTDGHHLKIAPIPLWAAGAAAKPDPVSIARTQYGDVPADFLASVSPEVIADGSATSLDAYMHGVASREEQEEAFYVMDLQKVLKLWGLWSRSLPSVTPYYAVKCNPDAALMGLLASLGAGFDVASVAELEAVMALGVPASNTIYANPCKLPSHLRAAAGAGVNFTTFDSVEELAKLKRCSLGIGAVLRIRADDPDARCPLGVKYGAEMHEVESLLVAAKKLGVNVVGVAFHVGSGSSNPISFVEGIRSARVVFDRAVALGFPPLSLLDIGGGFSCDATEKGSATFVRAAAAIEQTLGELFPEAEEGALKVIAEPGRFFAEAPFTLAANVFGKRVRSVAAPEGVFPPPSAAAPEKRMEYWINDGLYGSMNCLLYDHAVLSARPLPVGSAAGRGVADMEVDSGGLQAVSQEGEGKGGGLLRSTVFGPTCDGLDVVLQDVMLPELNTGDWLVFPNMGAYTKAAGSSFNGFAMSMGTKYVISPPQETSSVGSSAFSANSGTSLEVTAKAATIEDLGYAIGSPSRSMDGIESDNSGCWSEDGDASDPSSCSGDEEEALEAYAM